MWLRTIDAKWYIHELRGACYVSWVSAKDKANSAIFPKGEISKWKELLSEMTGLDIEAVEPFV
jgi:hypothetical protein